MTEPDRSRPDQPLDELAAIGALLAVPPPSPEVTAAARARLAQVSEGGGAAARQGPARRTRRRPVPGRPAWRLRSGSRWLAPAGAAVAVAVVVSASVVVARTVAGGPSGPATAGRGPGAIAQVPKFFVSLSFDGFSKPAVVSATATGKVLGSVAVPRPAHVFSMAASAGNGRDFVLAASRGNLVNKRASEGPTRFYRLVLSPSGRPGRLTPLPIPVQTRAISGLALSADGGQLAVSLYPPGNLRDGGTIKIFSLATGAQRDWAWPGPGYVGWGQNSGIPTEFDARSMSWTADGRRLLFQVQHGYGGFQTSQVRLLDTTSPGGGLRAASTLVPIPAADLDHSARHAPFNLDGPLMITGDGTMVVGTAHRMLAPVGTIMRISIAEFSVRTGKLERVLYEQKISYDNGAGLLWANRDGTAVIAGLPLPRPHSVLDESVLGVQTLTGFTALPASIQHRRLQPHW